MACERARSAGSDIVYAIWRAGGDILAGSDIACGGSRPLVSRSCPSSPLPPVSDGPLLPLSLSLSKVKSRASDHRRPSTGSGRTAARALNWSNQHQVEPVSFDLQLDHWSKRACQWLPPTEVTSRLWSYVITTRALRAVWY
eukprot:39279-Rhodomonas_salina.2